MHTPFEAAWQSLMGLQGELLARCARPLKEGGIDPAVVLRQLAEDYARDPARWQTLQHAWYEEQRTLWSTADNPATAAGDRRFRAPEWREPWFERIAASYLASARWLTHMVEGSALPAQDKRRAAFLVRQWVDAASPANYAWSNPEAIKRAHETQGDSVARGLKNLRNDLPRGMVSMTDTSAFEVGRNLAATPGSVVFENELMQLIQYRPATETVYARPLLMVPPCINKFYVLDLQPENSLVRYAEEQGHTVFMVSWRNVPESMGTTTWDDYIEQGVIAAIHAVTRMCGVRKINALGFCVGGTLLATALAVLRARGKNPAASLTLLATLLDFSETGELSVFINEDYVRKREGEFTRGGVVPGRELALTFASLRANDLIWNYVVSNYLKGETPPPFDLLYWNSDSTNLPGTMYCWYVRNAYLENKLAQPGAVTVCGVPLDFGKLDLPAYLLATREDHIVPWQTAHASTRLLKGKLTFVLGASGHIAGVINPATRNRRSYWTNPDAQLTPEDWLAGARENPGSWWAHWAVWLAGKSGKKIPARATPGGASYTSIEAAPGRYARETLK